MRILCRAEQETRDQNIVSMAADDIIQLRQLRERMQVEYLIKSKDRLSACIDEIINKLRVERNSVKDLRNLLQSSFDGVQGMLEDSSRLTDRMRDTFTRPPYLDNKALQGALKNQEECVACLREWMLQAQEWHQLSLKKLELLIESRSTAIEEYLDRRIAIDDWDFEMTSTTEATMLLTSALDQLDRDSDVTSAILLTQLIDPFPVVSFCKDDPAPFGSIEGTAQVSQAVLKLRDWQTDAAQTLWDSMNAVTADMLKDSVAELSTGQQL